MIAQELTYQAELPEGATAVLAPGGMVTPHGSSALVAVQGGTAQRVLERHTDQTAWHILPGAGPLHLTYQLRADTGPYPDAIFAPTSSRYTRYAEDMLDEVAPQVASAEGVARAIAVANATAARFTYGHPQARFNDGLDAVPALGCGVVEGSCVDINTYFIAALRAAGIEAGYVTGAFFPAEKRDWCEDGHCWVVTRIDGETLEWDIAHHLKLGLSQIAPGLNPKPGQRVALFHSMGLSFDRPAVTDLKALIEPLPLGADPRLRFAAPQIRLHAAPQTEESP